MMRVIAVVLLVCTLLSGCVSAVPTPSPTPAPLSQPSATSPPAPPTLSSLSQPSATVPPAPTSTPAPLRAWIDPRVPRIVRDKVTDSLAVMETVHTDAEADADLRIGLDLEVPLAQWAFVLAAPFPTVADEVSWSELRRLWVGEAGALTAISGDAEPPTLFITADTLAVLQALLGPFSTQSPISVVEAGELLDRAWEARPHALAILPFDQLQPRWKVLKLDGVSVLDRPLDIATYPLTVSIGAEGKAAEELAAAMNAPDGLLTNRTEGQMVTLVMTGVTALVRGTAYRMEQRGVLYPAEHIATVLQEADVLHISNEVPFAKSCPPADPKSQSLVFCTNPTFIELLEFVGTDVVELTGNHAMDYGPQPMLDTVEMYRDRGWVYFGGGEDLEDSLRPAIVEKDGTRLGFIGCNPVGPAFGWATEDSPGYAPCEPDYLAGRVAELKQQVDVTIATMQYWEFYQYEPTWKQQQDFRGFVDAGAAIVSGSQAHHPQAIEFYRDGFIHYGLGNLFFDQMYSLGTRQIFVDRHVIYEGRHISTELLTYMLEDYCQPRPMTLEERRTLLRSVFEASGW